MSPSSRCGGFAYESEIHFHLFVLHEPYYPERGSRLSMNRKILVMAVGISFLLVLPALAVRPVTATASTGLYAAFWKGTFFGSPMASWPSCTSESSPPAGVPSSTPPTATEIDPSIAHGVSTGFYWDETSPGFNVSGVQFYDTAFSVEWTGYIYLYNTGAYYFQLTSDDGSWLYINTTAGSSTISAANLVINDGGMQPPTSATSGPVSVKSSGWYPIEVDYYETCDTQSGIDLSWGSPTGGFTVIPWEFFMPAQIGSNAPISPSPVPQFGLAAPAVAVVGLLAFALVRKRTFGRIDTTT